MTQALSHVEGPAGGLAVHAGEVDIQISTAKTYPRSLATFLERSAQLATMTPDIAARCIYKLPRKDKDGNTKQIEGPSVRLAEVVEQTWGNMRVQAKVNEEAENYVEVSCLAWDLESNIANVITIRRRIASKNGRRYSDDMVNVTTMAALAIARRNAIFSVIPGGYTAQLMDTCRVAISAAPRQGVRQSLSARVARALKWFAKNGAPEAAVLELLDVQDRKHLEADHLETLEGIRTAIMDEEATIEDTFNLHPARQEEEERRPARRRRPAPKAAEDPPAADASASPPSNERTKQEQAATGTNGKEQEQEAAAADVLISRDQRGELMGLCEDNKVEIEDLIAHLQATYEISTTRDLRAADLDDVQEWIQDNDDNRG